MTLTLTMPTVADLHPGDVIANAETADPLTVIEADPPENGLVALTYSDAHGKVAMNMIPADAHVDRIKAVETYPATDLYRSMRVVIRTDETPHLVDRIMRRADGSARVTYSSGLVRDYAPGAHVVAR